MSLQITLKQIVLNPNSDVPLYRQLADVIYGEIVSGRVEAGDKLPTVRELADELGFSRGTIKHAYEHLERIGAVEMIQGSGSFVLGSEDDATSRKEKAMAAIDRLFSEMEELGFTPREIEIYCKLKLQGLEEKYDLVKAAIVDCNPETIKQIEQQLLELDLLEAASFSLSDVSSVSVAEKLNHDYDLIITTSTHFAEVGALVRDNEKMTMISMVPDMETIISLARLASDASVGIVCASSNFADIIRRGCYGMGKWSEQLKAMYFGNVDVDDVAVFLQQHSAIIVPKTFDTFASSAEVAALLAYERDGGNLIRYGYEIDRGSFLYLKELVKRTLNKKRSL